MKIIESDLDGVLIIEPDVFEDERGYFMETYQREKYAEVGIDVNFVQDNLSFSKKGTLRGLHYQHPKAQAKLVQVVDGEIYDVVVDIRRGSPTYGQWIGEYLSGENKRQVLIPEGLAHGYCALSDTALFSYKCSDFYAPENEHGVLWSDPGLAIKWPLKPAWLSDKDGGYPCLEDLPDDHLPVYEDLQ